jgi:hypothetical protein
VRFGVREQQAAGLAGSQYVNGGCRKTISHIMVRSRSKPVD